MHRKEDRTCYLCMKLHQDYMERVGLQEHHVVFGTANRKLSEKYGLKIYLCDEHHEHSDEAIHNNADIRQQICEDAQRIFEKHYPNLSFKEIFGINYISHTDISPVQNNDKIGSSHAGFIFLEDIQGEF